VDFSSEARVAGRSVCQRKKRDVVEQHGASARATGRFALRRSRRHAGEAQRLYKGEDNRGRRGLGGWTTADGPAPVATLRRTAEAGGRFARAGQRTHEGSDKPARGAGTHGAAFVPVW